jgi:clan AA aspartic protease
MVLRYALATGHGTFKAWHMGIIHADLQLTNQFSKKSVCVRALVDTGATHMTVTADVARQLGFDLDEMSTYRLTVADGRRLRVPRIQPVEIRFGDRSYSTEAAVLGNECLMGCLLLEALDLVVDPVRQLVVPNPEHPDGPVYLAKRLAIRHAVNRMGFCGTPITSEPVKGELYKKELFLSCRSAHQSDAVRSVLQ